MESRKVHNVSSIKIELNIDLLRIALNHLVISWSLDIGADDDRSCEPTAILDPTSIPCISISIGPRGRPFPGLC
jgi:hypothetical protein